MAITMAAAVKCFLFLFIIPAFYCDRFWDDLQVANYYTIGRETKLPRTVSEAKAKGWRLQDMECGGDKGYQGYKWVDQTLGDAIALLFDEIGFIAGMQAVIPSKEAKKIGVPSDAQIPPFVKHPAYPIYYITIYFVEPSMICTGRTAEEFETQGTGTGLIIQNGHTMIRIPINERKISAPWVRGQCYVLIGRYYWYKLQIDMSSDSLFPVVPVYNGQDLTGFAIVYAANLQNRIYGHRVGKNMDKFMKSVPKSFENSTFSMYQVYFTSNLGLNFC